MSKRGVSFFSWLGCCLATWVMLLCAILPDLDKAAWDWGVTLAAPSLAVFFAWKALQESAALGRWARVVFWMGTAPLATIFAFVLEGWHEMLTYPGYQTLQAVAMVLPVLAVCLAVVVEIRAGRLKTLGFGWALEILAGAALLAALAVSAYVACQKVYVDPFREKAWQRWAEIGRPMPEFEKSLTPLAENESLRELLRDLGPYGVITLYKTRSEDDPAGRNTFNPPPEVIDILTGPFTAGDPVRMPAETSAAMDAWNERLDRLYSGILRRESPVWRVDPRGEGMLLRVPNYLTLRKLAQWMAADAYYRLALGDREGAAMASAAGQRVTRNLGEQPVIVSVMIHTAVEALFAPITARLPADPEAMKRLADEVEPERRHFERAVQTEAWVVMRTLDKNGYKVALGRDPRFLLSPWVPAIPAWLGRGLWPAYRRSVITLACSKTCLYHASTVEIYARVRELASADLGRKELDANEKRATFFASNVSRTWLRLNCSLLLREQMEMIRAARARVEAGESGDPGGYPSSVAPGTRWLITSSPDAITLKLTPCPEWAAGNDVVGNDFWLVPPDGSKPWPLKPTPEKPHGESSQKNRAPIRVPKS